MHTHILTKMSEDQLKTDRLRLEKMLERDPHYLETKERILIQKMADEDSPFFHPCQNSNNTMTLLSGDKKHEIEVEFSEKDSTAHINILRIDPVEAKSFIDLLHVIVGYMNDRLIQTVYQSIIPIDWTERLSKIDGFRLISQVDDEVNPFIMVATDVKSFIRCVTIAMGFDRPMVNRA